MAEPFVEIKFNQNDTKLKDVFDNIYQEILSSEGEIIYKQYKFNNYIGDVTKGIRWTWATNEKAKELFDIKEIKEQINQLFNNDFKIRGASFITLYEKEIKDSDFHLDINTHYDKIYSTNTLTVIFPLYIEKDMGNLEYKDLKNKMTKIYTYKQNHAFVWDACKLLHRTQPYSLQEKKKRVLVSINLSSDEEWAIKTVSNSLKLQGNLL